MKKGNADHADAALSNENIIGTALGNPDYAVGCNGTGWEYLPTSPAKRQGYDSASKCNCQCQKLPSHLLI